MDFILDLMKLDVPDLFYDIQGRTSVPGASFKEYLHQYIASNGLSKELLKRVDKIMVSWFDCDGNSSNNHTPGWVTA